MTRKKTKPSKAVKAYDYILLDRSQSMGPKWKETLGAVNGYVEKIKQDKADSVLTVATFDSISFDIIRDAVPLKEWKKVTDGDATPRAMTPLYDAIGKIVTKMEAEKPKRAVLIVVTDGEENMSRKGTRDTAKAALDRIKDKGWQVIFLGADFDNFAQGKSVGLSHDTILQASAGNYTTALRNMASSRNLYASTGAAMCFSDDDRNAAIGKK